MNKDTELNLQEDKPNKDDPKDLEVELIKRNPDLMNNDIERTHNANTSHLLDPGA